MKNLVSFYPFIASPLSIVGAPIRWHFGVETGPDNAVIVVRLSHGSATGSRPALPASKVTDAVH